MTKGRIPLVAGLKCATEIAKVLSDLHQQGHAHGRVTPSSVILTDSGADLLPTRAGWEQDALEHDVSSFGAVLYEIIMGSKPPLDASAGSFRAPGPKPGLIGVRSSAIRLAGKCLGYFPVTLSMQQAATEVRLLWVLARQLEADGATEPPPMSAPFLVSPALAKPREPVAKAKPPAKPYEPVKQPPPEALEPEYEFDLIPGEQPVVQPGASDFTKPEEESKVGPKIADGVPACPKCDGSPVFVSRPRTFFERRLVSWNVPICRCHRCYHRYIVIGGMRIRKRMPRYMERRFKPKGRS